MFHKTLGAVTFSIFLTDAICATISSIYIWLF